MLRRLGSAGLRAPSRAIRFALSPRAVEQRLERGRLDASCDPMGAMLAPIDMRQLGLWITTSILAVAGASSCSKKGDSGERTLADPGGTGWAGESGEPGDEPQDDRDPREPSAASGGRTSTDPGAAGAPSTMEEPLFESCEAGTVQTSVSSFGVISCENCQIGEYCAGGDHQRERCETGTWDDDSDPQTPCVPWQICPPGTFVALDGSSRNDRQCQECETGFADAENASSCLPWSHCLWGKRDEGNASRDTSCIEPHSIEAGADGSCVSFNDGSTKCFGNISGLLSGSSVVPTRLDLDSPVSVDLDAGRDNGCVLFEDGSAKCWGDHPGNGSDTSAGLSDTVQGLADIVEIRAGWYHGCARTRDTGVHCWGSNEFGSLGSSSDEDSLVPVRIDTPENVEALGVGAAHTCVLAAGSVTCWGFNSDGELGNGGFEHGRIPAPVPDLSGVTALAVGWTHTCALLTDSTVKCWGDNQYGQLGNGTRSDTALPTRVARLNDVVSLSAGALGTCAVLRDGTARCWGFDMLRGDGEAQNTALPVEVTTLSKVETISIGYAHACALLEGGAVSCWGENGTGQLGDGSTQPSRVPIEVLRVQ